MTRAATPPPAALVQAFINTFEPRTGTDALADPTALAAWWAAQGLVPRGTAAGPTDLAVATAVREGLRNLLLRHAGHEPDPDAVDRMRRTLDAVPLRLELNGDSCRLASTRDDPADVAFAALLDAVRHCHQDGSWARLKVCARDSCRWAFYDASRNQVRRWCSMAECGNIVKMRRSRAARGRRPPQA